MKKVILLFIFGLYIFPTFGAFAEFNRPSEQRIIERLQKIERAEKNNIYIRHALIAACAGLAGYGLYHNFINPQVEAKPMVGTPLVRLAELSAQFDRFKKERGFIWWLEEKLTSGFQGFLVQMGLIMCMSYVGEKISQQKHTIEWFISNNTRLQRTLTDLVEHTDKCKNKADCPQQLICIAYNNVLEDVEQVIAFMEYKASCMEAQKGQSAFYLARTLYFATDKVCSELQEHVVHTGPEIAKSALLFQQTVVSLISTFAALEREDTMAKQA